MRTLLIVLIIFSCESIDNTPYYHVDANLNAHLDTFIIEMESRGVEVTIPNKFSIQFDSSIPQRRAVTRHNKNEVHIYVSDYYLDKVDSPVTELVIYHELGHGLLKLSHHPLETHMMYYTLNPQHYIKDKEQRLNEMVDFYKTSHDLQSMYFDLIGDQTVIKESWK